MLRPELVTYLLDSLYENQIPFVFSYPSRFASLTKEYADQVNSQEDCCIVKFAPQWAALEHPATGYFVVFPPKGEH